ncbi:MAG: hypothetical protein P3T54_00215 [Dehalogenimonas sp.]|nr:hypothetical protein [Dehalogenimonas sp.]
MAEWHITPDYIVRNWTDELLDLMVRKLVERKEREAEMYRNKGGGSGDNLVSEEELFSQFGDSLKVVKADKT